MFHIGYKGLAMKKHISRFTCSILFFLAACDSTDSNRQAKFDMRNEAYNRAENSEDGVGIGGALISHFKGGTYYIVQAVDLSMGNLELCAQAYGGNTNNIPGISLSFYNVRQAQSDYGPFCDHGRYLSKQFLMADHRLSIMDLDFSPNSFNSITIESFLEEAKIIVMEDLGLDSEISFDEYAAELRRNAIKQPEYKEALDALITDLRGTALNLRNTHFVEVGCQIATRKIQDLSTPEISKQVSDNHRDEILSDARRYQAEFNC